MRHVIYYLIVIQHLFGNGVTDSKEEIQTAEGTGTIFVAPSQSGSDIVFSATEASILGSATTSFERPDISCQPSQSNDFCSHQRALAMQVLPPTEQAEGTTLWYMRLCLAAMLRQLLCPQPEHAAPSSMELHRMDGRRRRIMELCNKIFQVAKKEDREVTQTSQEEQGELYSARLRPPWNAKGQPNAPTVTSTDSGAPSGQAEEQLQSLVSKLKEKEAPLSPEEVEHIIAETTTTTVTSKNLNQAARKLDQAREKFQGAQKERRNLYTKWSSYIEESVKRWKSFAEDFASKDAALEDKVQKAKEVMQTAKANLETIKELHSKQDEAFLGDVMEVPSGADEEAMKVESAEAIQQGIASMVSSLDAIRIKPADEENAEASVAKKPKLAHAGPGSASLQPFGKPSK
jgi:hypothetical protein